MDHFFLMDTIKGMNAWVVVNSGWKPLIDDDQKTKLTDK